MILTDKKIRELAENEQLIAPFCEEHLQSESYDVTIGTEITVMKKEIRCLDISEQGGIDGIYNHIDISGDGYTISPKEYVLVSLGETIKVPNNLTVHLRPKTRYTRLGLIVSDQHCNSTYTGHLRIGLFNATEYPIRIHTGFAIAQLVFEELDGVPSSEKLYENKKNAHYQNENGAFRGAKFDDVFLDAIWDKILD
ncbi:dCTP deaminase [Schaedlerella arabinosiphila]|uniref:dCTP deaminase n=1 Tax=Schaedlerella arabinosiphila TaxID=2044587 RepID=A0A9X5H960_9FIRM|nr:dCTP deaminase [Schaedlerella arabinosiphila]KAI4442008.1 dCTP deaminase, dUMP-forming [Schaedlerella arabinosiphila]MCI9633803.1 dCTP deaminase [Ruminococcus sp.]NDO71081.1 dCTP deaminase [Schaedlerella arabinosiphila]